MTAQQDSALSLSGYDGGADGLLDRIELGVEFDSPRPLPEVVADLQEAGLLPERRLRSEGAGHFDILTHSDRPCLRAPLHFTGRLSLAAAGSGVRASGGSGLILNPLRTLRYQVEPVCDVADGEDDNVVGPSADPGGTRRLLGLQLDSIRRAVEDLIEVLEAVGGRVRLRVREAEVCRDLAVADPVAAVHLLGRSPNPFTAVTRATPFSGDAILEGVGNAMVVRWQDGRKTNPVRYKFYPKGRWLRCEVALLGPAAVARAIGQPRGGSPWCATAEEVEDVLRQVAGAAAPDLDTMEEHLGEVLSSAAHGVSLFDIIGLTSALAPLAALAAGQREGRGRPLGEPQRALAEDILHQMMLHGRYDIRGSNAGEAIKRALEEACQSGLVAVAGERGSLYSVVPAAEGARLGIAATVAAGRAAGQAPEPLPARRLRQVPLDEGDEDEA